jgi:hypothetical protein
MIEGTVESSSNLRKEKERMTILVCFSLLSFFFSLSSLFSFLFSLFSLSAFGLLPLLFLFLHAVCLFFQFVLHQQTLEDSVN